MRSKEMSYTEFLDMKLAMARQECEAVNRLHTQIEITAEDR